MDLKSVIQKYEISKFYVPPFEIQLLLRLPKTFKLYGVEKSKKLYSGKRMLIVKVVSLIQLIVAISATNAAKEIP